MYDFLEQSLKVGDNVIFILRLSGTKVNLELGRIKIIGKSKITVEYCLDDDYTDDKFPTVSITLEKIYKIQK